MHTSNFSFDNFSWQFSFACATEKFVKSEIALSGWDGKKICAKLVPRPFVLRVFSWSFMAHIYLRGSPVSGDFSTLRSLIQFSCFSCLTLSWSTGQVNTLTAVCFPFFSLLHVTIKVLLPSILRAIRILALILCSFPAFPLWALTASLSKSRCRYIGKGICQKLFAYPYTRANHLSKKICLYTNPPHTLELSVSLRKEFSNIVMYTEEIWYHRQVAAYRCSTVCRNWGYMMF